MTRKLGAVVSISIMLAVVLVMPAVSSMPMNDSIFDLTRQSDVILTGIVIELEPQQNTQPNTTQQGSGSIMVKQVLKGKVPADRLVITGLLQSSCVISYYPVKVGDEAVFFLKAADNQTFTVTGNGGGCRVLKADSRNLYLSAVRRLIVITNMNDVDKETRAILAEAPSINKVMRNEVRNYAAKLSYRDDRQKYKGILVNLLKSPVSDARLTALYGLERINAPEALPAIIDQLSDKDPAIMHAASEALRIYDTEMSVNALISFAARSGDDLRSRAIIDLGVSKRPNAMRIVVMYLDDPNPRVRCSAASALISPLREGKSLEAIPQLIRMLDDSDEEVVVSAAIALGESRQLSAVEPLLNVLKREALSERVEGFVVQALGILYRDLPSGAKNVQSRKIIDRHLDLIIASLNRGSWLSSLSAVGILAASKEPEAAEALRYASSNNPLPDIREYAAKQIQNR